MAQSSMRYLVGGIILLLLSGNSPAQSTPPRDALLMQNYRFTGPPPPHEVKPVDSVLIELQGIQSVLRTILTRARFDGDYEAALAAAGQAAANAQLIGAIAQRRQSAQASQPAKPAADQTQPAPPLFLIAMKDRTIHAARSYWVDGPMLNYITLEGVHVIVRLDLVDRGLSRELNRQRNVEFNIPE
jgi:hypothetical protein